MTFQTDSACRVCSAAQLRCSVTWCLLPTSARVSLRASLPVVYVVVGCAGPQHSTAGSVTSRCFLCRCYLCFALATEASSEEHCVVHMCLWHSLFSKGQITNCGTKSIQLARWHVQCHPRLHWTFSGCYPAESLPSASYKHVLLSLHHFAVNPFVTLSHGAIQLIKLPLPPRSQLQACKRATMHQCSEV